MFKTNGIHTHAYMQIWHKIISDMAQYPLHAVASHLCLGSTGFFWTLSWCHCVGSAIFSLISGGSKFCLISHSLNLSAFSCAHKPSSRLPHLGLLMWNSFCLLSLHSWKVSASVLHEWVGDGGRGKVTVPEVFKHPSPLSHFTQCPVTSRDCCCRTYFKDRK